MKKLISAISLALFAGACTEAYEVAYAPSIALEKARADGYARALAAQTSPAERRALMFQQCQKSMTSEDLAAVKRRGQTVSDACSCIVETFDERADENIWNGALLGARSNDFQIASDLFAYSVKSCGLKMS